MNAVVISVLVMLILSIARVHVVISLFSAALIAGLTAHMSVQDTMVAFQEGLSGGARIALSYALLGAFAMAVANSGLPQLLADWLIRRMDVKDSHTSRNVAQWTKWGIITGIVAMGVMSQNLIPIHIAFIPLLIPPLISVMNELQLDRRAIACAITFGIVTTYMFLPIGFGRIYLHDILYANIESAGMDLAGVSPTLAMGIPAASMLIGLLIALFISYRQPRVYTQEASSYTERVEKVDVVKVWGAVAAIAVCFIIQTWLTASNSEADPLLIGALVGLSMMLLMRVVPWNQADDVFTGGMKMMSIIGLIMITAQGYAAVLKATGHIEPLVQSSASLFSGSKALGAFIMLVVGLIITMGIGSSFSTLPIIAAIYVPLCSALGFSPAATVAMIGTAGALGDAGSPASDSTLGPTTGLNVDGQHDHMRDTVIPTFLHFNVPLLIGGWIAAMIL